MHPLTRRAEPVLAEQNAVQNALTLQLRGERQYHAHMSKAAQLGRIRGRLHQDEFFAQAFPDMYSFLIRMLNTGDNPNR